MEKSYYEILNVSRCDNQGKIKQEYQWRLDEEIGEYGRLIDEGIVPCIDRINEINIAFTILADPYRKKEYDCELDGVQFDRTPYTFDITDDSIDYSINEYKDMIKWLNNKIQVMQLLNDSLKKKNNIKKRNNVVSIMMNILENLNIIIEEKEKQISKKKLLTGDK